MNNFGECANNSGCNCLWLLILLMCCGGCNSGCNAGTSNSGCGCNIIPILVALCCCGCNN